MFRRPVKNCFRSGEALLDLPAYFFIIGLLLLTRSFLIPSGGGRARLLLLHIGGNVLGRGDTSTRGFSTSGLRYMFLAAFLLALARAARFFGSRDYVRSSILR